MSLRISLLLGFLIQLASCNRQITTVGTTTIAWQNLGSVTIFNLSSTFEYLVSSSNVWLGIGLNNQAKMNGTDAVICRNGNGNRWIRRYVNSVMSSSLLNQAIPSYGLFDTSVSVSGNTLLCNFARANTDLTIPNVYQINTMTQPYILIAYGIGDPQFHVYSGHTQYKASFPYSQSGQVTATTNKPSTTTSRVTPWASSPTTAFLNNVLNWFLSVLTPT